MLVKKGTFIFNCTTKGGIPMIVEKCRFCKLSKQCTLQDAMRKMEDELEHDIRYETSENLFLKFLGG